MSKIRITIEYDPDAPQGQLPDVTLISERKDWLDGNVTIADAITTLKYWQRHDSDPETAHRMADDVLCQLLTTLGYKDVVIEWGKIKKWYA